MENTKKDLLIFFGEFRTFDVILPQLKDLDKVDIIVSTWEQSKYSQNGEYSIESVKKIIPHAKFLIEPVIHGKLNNTGKMYYHWKKSINSIIDKNQYNNVILHRTDMISNWHKILNTVLTDDTLYISHGRDFEINSFWVNDYFIIGKYPIIKKFINLITEADSINPHIPLGNIIINNKIQYQSMDIGEVLIRTSMKNLMKTFNENNIILLDTNTNSTHRKKYVDEYNELSPNHQLGYDIFGR